VGEEHEVVPDALAHHPADGESRAEIADSREVEPALGRCDHRDLDAPPVVGPADVHPSRWTKRLWLIAAAVLGAWLVSDPGQAVHGQTCPCTIWSSTTTPTVASSNDSNAVELGVKFRATTNGYITALRFYKGPANTGTHVGNLWTSTGTLLETVTFTNETASGWQQATLPSPVAITANTTYVASYHTNVGGYAGDGAYFTAAGVNNPPLQALANGVDGGNGVYQYGSGGFPNQTYNAANYWIDVVFSTTIGTTAPPTITTVSPTNGSSGVSPGTAVTVTFSKAMDPRTVDSSTVQLQDPSTTVLPATVTYNGSTFTATLQPTDSLANSATYTATVKGGATGVKDLTGGGLAGNVAWSFTTAAMVTCPCTIWNSTTTPIVASANDPNAVELGVKFRATMNGYITALRFYKGPANTGTHVGNLWTSTGRLLASVTFTNETASGWQQATLPSPVAISANTTYVASYHTNVGGYAADGAYFAPAGVNNPPLQALGDGVDGGNGVYQYGPSSFPSQSYNAGNYWVDVVFTSPQTATQPILSATPSSLSFSAALGGPDPRPASLNVNNLGAGTLNFTASGDASWLQVSPVSGTAPQSVQVSASAAGLAPGSYTGHVTITASGAQGSPAVVLITLTVSQPSAQIGQWSGPLNWPLVAIHMLLLRTGQVLTWEGEGDITNGGATARLWDPATGTFTPLPTTTNIWCAGHSALADGRFLVVGGHEMGSGDHNLGTFAANLFDPATQSWRSAAAMNFPRWYPTATTLPDGRVLVASGSQRCDTCIAEVPEIYNPATDTWVQLTNAKLVIPLYPYMFVLPDGRVLHAGSFDTSVVSRVLAVDTQTWTIVDPNVVDGGSAVMYLPGKVMKSGSVAQVPTVPATANTYVLDMTQPSPGWRQTASMAFPRAHHNLTVLPDGSVLVTGGGQTTDYADPSGAVYAAELWSPVTTTWTVMANMQVPRLYHSTALLLPDGRVLVAGGGRDFGRAVNHLDAEIYSPPYLFKGTRPTISSAPTTMKYGSTFFIATPDASNIASVSLVRPGAVTHSFNEDQRFLSLAFQPTSGGLNVQAPANANLAPPAYYMLFIVNANGVPSIASFVRVPDAPVLSVSPSSLSLSVMAGGANPSPASLNVGDLVPGSMTFTASSDVSWLSVLPTSGAAPQNVQVSASVTGLAPGSYTGHVTITASGAQGSPAVVPVTLTVWSCPCTIWNGTTGPTMASASDSNAVELGVKFRTTVNGYITALRFYKGPANTGTHVGNLWTSTGSLLASVTFTNETASGWQQATLPSPVAISANTTYVASYHTNVGGYAADGGYFATSGVNNPPLQALGNGVDGGNGMYRYGPSSFPNQSYNASNYWIDVVFSQ
jgi:hypothetical protein